MGIFDGMSEMLFGDPSLGDTKRLLEENKRLYDAIDLPHFKDYAPEALTTEAGTAELIGEDPNKKAMQMQALEKMLGLSEQGLSAEDELAFMEAESLANQESKQARDALMQNAQARGVAGSGLEFALAEQANQGASERARRAAMERAATSARMRALNNNAYMNALSGVRDQDYRTEAANTDALNRFNQMNLQNRNQARQYNVGQRNQAQQYNNDLRQRNFQNEVTKADGVAGVNRDLGNAYASEQAARNQNRNQLVSGIIRGGSAYFGGGQ